jgi:hypothetical protein
LPSHKKSKNAAGYPVAGTIHANIQIPKGLHDAMKAIRAVRHEREGADVKLCRLYREAVEQYVSAKPQQELLQASRSRGHKLRAAG